MEFCKHSNLTNLQSSIRCFPHLYSKIRDQTTPPQEFARYSRRIMSILSEEGVAISCSNPIEITTPTNSTISGQAVDVSEVVAISIIRAGDSMLDTFMSIVPEAKVGKILIQRNEETAEPILFYTKFPNLTNHKIFLLDPMLATGGSAMTAIREVITRGAVEENITFINVVSSPEGIFNIFAAFPKISIVTGWIDDGLNEKKYIVPGLGDFGDRYFGTV